MTVLYKKTQGIKLQSPRSDLLHEPFLASKSAQTTLFKFSYHYGNDVPRPLEIMHFPDSPYCFVLFPHTSMGLPYLHV
jgi:hypothetical protein